MAGSGRTLADWIWTFIGLAGVACILIAAWIVFPKGDSTEDVAARVEEHYRAGDEKLRAGDADAAIEELQRAAQLIDGRNPVVQNRLGEAFRTKGEGEKAARCWFAALSLAPLFAPPYLNLATWFEEKGDAVAASGFYRTARALFLSDDSVDLTEKLARAEEKARPILEERAAKARKDYRANPANPDALTVLLVYRLATVKTAEDAIASAGIRAALTGVAEAIGDLEARIERQRTACRDRPESVIDRSGLALLLLLAGSDEAGTVADEAMGISDSDRSALFAISLADLFRGTDDLSRMEEAAKRMSGNPVLWLAFGAAAIGQKETDVARGALANVLRLQPMLIAYPAIPEVYRLHALMLTDSEAAGNREKFREAYRRLID